MRRYKNMGKVEAHTLNHTLNLQYKLVFPLKWQFTDLSKEIPQSHFCKSLVRNNVDFIQIVKPAALYSMCPWCRVSQGYLTSVSLMKKKKEVTKQVRAICSFRTRCWPPGGSPETSWVCACCKCPYTLNEQSQLKVKDNLGTLQENHTPYTHTKDHRLPWPLKVVLCTNLQPVSYSCIFKLNPTP